MMSDKSAFLQMVEHDISAVFLDLDEFAEEHIIEGKKMRVVFTMDQNIPINGGYKLGVSDSTIILFASERELPSRKESGEALGVDGREYNIDNWDVQMGMAIITLSQAVMS